MGRNAGAKEHDKIIKFINELKKSRMNAMQFKIQKNFELKKKTLLNDINNRFHRSIGWKFFSVLFLFFFYFNNRVLYTCAAFSVQYYHSKAEVNEIRL